MEEEKKTQDNSDGVLDVLGAAAERFGSTLLDETANRIPIAGPALQAAFNTQSYQDRQNKAEYERRANAQKMADLAFKEKNRDVLEQKELDNAAITAEKRKQNEITTGILQQRADALTIAGMTDEAGKKFREQLDNSPLLAGLKIDEKEKLMQSPRVARLVEGKAYQNLLTQYANGDQNAGAMLERAIRRTGWNIKMGDDNIPYIDMGNGKKLAATPENVAMFDKQFSDAVLEEINVRNKISDHATSGNPVLRAAAQCTKAAMPFNRNDATETYRMIEGMINNASEAEKGYFLFHRATADYNDSRLTQQEKLAGLAQAVPFLEKMGFKVDGFDVKNLDEFDPNAIQIIGPNGRMNLAEFSKLVEENDVVSRRLDNRIAQMQYDYLMKSGSPTVKAKAVASFEKGSGADLSDIVTSGSAKGKKKDGGDEPGNTRSNSFWRTPEEQRKTNAEYYKDDYGLLKGKDQDKFDETQLQMLNEAAKRGIYVKDRNTGAMILNPKIEQMSIKELRDFENLYEDALKKQGFDADQIEKLRLPTYPFLLKMESEDIAAQIENQQENLDEYKRTHTKEYANPVMPFSPYSNDMINPDQKGIDNRQDHLNDLQKAYDWRKKWLRSHYGIDIDKSINDKKRKTAGRQKLAEAAQKSKAKEEK